MVRWLRKHYESRMIFEIKFIFEMRRPDDKVQTQKSMILFLVKSRLTFKIEVFCSIYSISVTAVAQRQQNKGS